MTTYVNVHCFPLPRSIYPIHPGFRVVAVGEHLKSSGSSSQASWITPELLTMFQFHHVPPLPIDQEREVLMSRVSLPLPPPPPPHLLLLAQYVIHSYNYTSHLFVRFQVPKLPNTTMDSLLTITQSLRMSTDPTVSIAGMHAEEGGFGIPLLCIRSVYMYTCTKMYVQLMMFVHV